MENDWIIAFAIILVAGTSYFIAGTNYSLWRKGYDEGFRDAFDIINKYDEDFDNDKILALLKKALKPVVKADKRYARGDLKKIDECLTLDELRLLVTEMMNRRAR